MRMTTRSRTSTRSGMKQTILGTLAMSFLLVACQGSSPSASGASSSAAAASAAPQGATAAATAAPQGPKEKSITAKFCLGDDGTSQDCGISCKVDKDPDTCARWAEKTKALCAKLPKAKCQEICEKDENPTACELAKAMK
jgi:hypothetical protein